MAGAGASVGERSDRPVGHTQIAPALRRVNRNPAPRPGVPRPSMNPLAPQTRSHRGSGRPGTRIPISHQRLAMGTLFDIREHKMAETCGPVRCSR
jgi:hypothetical protein